MSNFRPKLEYYRDRVGLLMRTEKRINREKVLLAQKISFKRTMIDTLHNGMNELTRLHRMRSELIRERKSLELEQTILASQRKDEIKRLSILEQRLRELDIASDLSSDFSDDQSRTVDLEHSLQRLTVQIADQERIASELELRAIRRSDDWDALATDMRGRLLRNEELELAEIREIERGNTILRNRLDLIITQRGQSASDFKPRMRGIKTRAKSSKTASHSRFRSRLKYKLLRDQASGLIARIEMLQRSIVDKKRSVRCKESDIALRIAETRKSFLLSDSRDVRSSVRLDVRRQSLKTHIECLTQTAKLLHRGRELSLEPVSLGLWQSQLEAVLSSVSDQITIQSVYSLLAL
jgi:hypothetical protein